VLFHQQRAVPEPLSQERLVRVLQGPRLKEQLPLGPVPLVPELQSQQEV